MKRLSHKIASILMAFVVLLSTMSFTIDMHYCGDTLVDTAFFVKAQSCGMEMEASTNENCSLLKKNCCSDHQISFVGQDELERSNNQITLGQQFFIVSFTLAYIDNLNGLKENITSFRDYVPPLVVRQIYKLDETYLI